jgi:hypothetical protein
VDILLLGGPASGCEIPVDEWGRVPKRCLVAYPAKATLCTTQAPSDVLRTVELFMDRSVMGYRVRDDFSGVYVYASRVDRRDEIMRWKSGSI